MTQHPEWHNRISFTQWADHILSLAADKELDEDDRRFEVKCAIQNMIEDARNGNYDPPTPEERHKT